MSFRDKVFQKYLQDIEDDLNYEADKFKELLRMGFETPDVYINKSEKDIGVSACELGLI